MHQGSEVADGWLKQAAERVGGSVATNVPGAGLFCDMARLDGPEFRAADLHASIRDFYEHTSQWRMEVWTQWNPLFQPAGELISRLWAGVCSSCRFPPVHSMSPTAWTAESSSSSAPATNRSRPAGCVRSERPASMSPAAATRVGCCPVRPNRASTLPSRWSTAMSRSSSSPECFPAGVWSYEFAGQPLRQQRRLRRRRRGRHARGPRAHPRDLQGLRRRRRRAPHAPPPSTLVCICCPPALQTQPCRRLSSAPLAADECVADWTARLVGAHLRPG